MIDWIGQPRLLSRIILIALLTATLSAVMQANFAILDWLRDSAYLHWVYITEGIKLLAIMVFGWPAVLSSALAFSIVHYFGDSQTIHWLVLLIMGLIEAASVWLAVDLFARISGVRYPWANLDWVHVPFLSLGSGGLSALGFFGAKEILLGDEAESFWRDVSLSILGDVLGIAVFIALMILLRKIYRRYIQNR